MATTFESIIDCWPSRVELARDLGVQVNRVQQWYERDSIPGAFFSAVVVAARARGYHAVTAESLMAAAAVSARRRRERREARQHASA